MSVWPRGGCTSRALLKTNTHQNYTLRAPSLTRARLRARMAAAEGEEVVPTGHALSVVRSWLPAAADDEDDALLDWGDMPEQDAPPRPARRVCGSLLPSRVAAR